MKVGTGSKADCLDNNSGYASQPGPSLADRREPEPVRVTSSRCVYLTCDLKDCMAFLERCSWVINQGMCIHNRPTARRVRRT
jgi:hypothetical protein